MNKPKKAPSKPFSTGLEFSVRGRHVQMKQHCKDGSTRIIVAKREDIERAMREAK